MRQRSSVPFVDPASGSPVDALAAANIAATSTGLGWTDLHVEVGYNPRPWEVDNLAVAAHYLALNTDARPLTFDADVEGRFRSVTIAPGQTWFCPAGATFSHRVPSPAAFALVTVTPARFLSAVDERLVGTVQLRRAYGVDQPQLAFLVQALVAEVQRGGPSGPMFVDALTIALASQLAAAFSEKAAAQAPADAGLPRSVLRRVLERIDSGLDGSLAIEDLAREAGLSPAHFARSFKKMTGKAPHQFVMQRRLDEARRALDSSDPDILNVALRFGFADQAHLTRLFKRAFNVTPGHYVRQRR